MCIRDSFDRAFRQAARIVGAHNEVREEIDEISTSFHLHTPCLLPVKILGGLGAPSQEMGVNCG